MDKPFCLFAFLPQKFLNHFKGNRVDYLDIWLNVYLDLWLKVGSGWRDREV